MLKRSLRVNQSLGPWGYTLVELMIVVVIIGIGSVVAAGALMESRKNTMLSEATREVAHILRSARSRALLRNVAVRIHITTAIDASTTTPNLRLDESLDTSCNSFPPPTNAVRFGVMRLDLSAGRWRAVTGSNVYISGMTVNGAAATTANLCINRQGRVLVEAAGGWVVVTAWPALEIRLQRQDDGVDVGVERIVRLEQGGVARIVR